MCENYEEKCSSPVYEEKCENIQEEKCEPVTLTECKAEPIQVTKKWRDIGKWCITIWQYLIVILIAWY